MIGSESYTVTRNYSYLFSGAAGTTNVPVTTLPSGGCYLRLEGTGTTGNVVITGTATDAAITETILSTSFDTDKVAVSTKKWTAITNISVASWTNLVVYPATTSGDKINLSTGTTFTMMCDSYDTNLNQYRGEYIDVAGKTYKVYKTLMYDGRYTLQIGDLITIGSKQFKVADVEPQHGLYSALLIIWR